MTFQMPNPAGNDRRVMRVALQQYIQAQNIMGLDHVYRSMPPEITFEEYTTGQSKYRCQAYVILPDDDETRYVLTGPVLPTGKLIHYRAQIEVHHRVYEVSESDWDDWEDDYDRIICAIKDCVRAQGRQLGRPTVVFSVGEFRQGITTAHQPPFFVDAAGGTAERMGMVGFEITQTV